MYSPLGFFQRSPYFIPSTSGWIHVFWQVPVGIAVGLGVAVGVGDGVGVGGTAVGDNDESRIFTVLDVATIVPNALPVLRVTINDSTPSVMLSGFVVNVNDPNPSLLIVNDP